MQFVGFLIILLCAGDYTQNKLKGTLVGYGFILVGVLIVTVLLIQKASNASKVPNMANAGSMMISIGPFITFMIIIMSLMYQVSDKFDMITQGHVSISFSNMMRLMVFLLALNMIVMNKSLNTKDFKESGSIGQEYGIAIYFGNMLASVILATIYILLTIYPTDGFVSVIGE